MAAIESALSSTLRRQERARRVQGRHGDLRSALAVLARLRARADDGTLATLSETRVEQSWNEQIFARVLGYRTLFSHDRMPYHLDPKRPARGRRYTDFVLGSFGRGVPIVLASAELKKPSFPQDKKQAGRPYFGATAVEQAHKTANLLQGCRWVVVSNYDETRLYRVGDPTPICTARLFEVRTLLDVADFAAHFDRTALLGDGEKVPSRLERILAMTDDHPAAIVAAAAGHVRLVARLNLAAAEGESLYDLERALRTGLSRSPAWADLTDARAASGEPRVELGTADGWTSAETESPFRAKVARSVLGEALYSVRIPLKTETFAMVNGQSCPVLSVGNVLRHVAVADELMRAVFKHALGTLTLELLDVKDVTIADVPNEWLVPGSLVSGVAVSPELVSSDFLWKPNVVFAAARALADLLVQFRSRGGGVLVDLEKVAKALQPAPAPTP